MNCQLNINSNFVKNQPLLIQLTQNSSKSTQFVPREFLLHSALPRMPAYTRVYTPLSIPSCVVCVLLHFCEYQLCFPASSSSSPLFAYILPGEVFSFRLHFRQWCSCSNGSFFTNHYRMGKILVNFSKTSSSRYEDWTHAFWIGKSIMPLVETQLLSVRKLTLPRQTRVDPITFRLQGETRNRTATWNWVLCVLPL